MTHLLTLAEAAEQGRCSVKTIKRRVADGTLPSVIGLSGRRLVRADDIPEDGFPKNRTKKTWSGLPEGPVVYFVQSGEFTKIGKANDLRARLDALQTGSPVKLEVVHTLPLTPGLESALHVCFKPFRTEGEWFRLPAHWRRWTDEVVAMVEAA